MDTNAPEHRRKITIQLLLIVGFVSILLRFLLDSNFKGSSLVYVGIPYLVALLIARVRSYKKAERGLDRFMAHVSMAFVVFLGSSILLFEGFICVLMFMPIYFFFVVLSYVIDAIVKRSRNRKYAVVFPVIILLLSAEGTHPNLSLSREETVVVSRNVALNVERINRNLHKPMDLNKDRHWFLELFPMPYEIRSDEFAEGAVHVVKTRYHRWFVTNTHEGEVRLKIVELNHDRIRSKVISDTSYFSNYIQAQVVQLEFEPINESETRVTLSIEYRRLLDPALYFKPLQRFAITEMANFLIDEVISHE